MPPSFPRSVIDDDNFPLDRSRGRVQLVGGDFFYSPNSQRIVEKPSVYNNIPSRDAFKDSFSEFRKPLWWHPDLPYLGFVPLCPSFAGVPFHDLQISHFPRRFHGGFSIDIPIVLGWARLERHIMDAVRLLLAYESAPKITWIVRTSLGCTGLFKQAYILRSYLTHSKSWFSLFMGGFSYAIAVSISQHRENLYEEMPYWFTFLSYSQFSQIWLSGIRSSMVATFDTSVERVGVFIQLCHRHRGQFSVDWLCKFGVPVWYSWGTNEAKAALTDASLARFLPLPYQLQEAGTFLSTNPTPPPHPQPTTEPQTQGFDCKPFAAYFTPYLFIFIQVLRALP
jgi:hypothetical protein